MIWSKPSVLAPNLLFPYIQLHLQGLQHPAPPYGAFLPCAPVLRWGCKHPGLQSSPGKNGQQQQHQTVAAGNVRGGRHLWRSMGSRAQCCRRTRVLSFRPPQSSSAVLEVPKQRALTRFPSFCLRPAFPRKGLIFLLPLWFLREKFLGLGFSGKHPEMSFEATLVFPL